MVLDELLPKKTGREAMIEKKKVKSEYTRRNKDEGVDVELGDGKFIQDGVFLSSTTSYLSVFLSLINIDSYSCFVS